LDNVASNALAAHMTHIAIIPDGNGRWAMQRHVPPTVGHQAGRKTLHRIIGCAISEQIDILTIYIFSTENWKRPRQEIEGIMQLFQQAMRRDAQTLYHAGVRVRILGRLQELSGDVQRALLSLMDLTAQNSRLTLNLCINYGGRAELVDAVRSIMAAGYAVALAKQALLLEG
jgi:undecaprenyl diphosphate synthase